MRYISGENSRQTNLLPPSIDEIIGEDNAIRLISLFVDSLDILGMGFKRSAPAMTRRPPYDPKDLLKLYIIWLYKRHQIFPQIRTRERPEHRVVVAA